MNCTAPWVYIATAQAHDEEMSARIAEHRQRRDGKWRTLEAPLDLPGRSQPMEMTDRPC